jgi:hypothetical protein
MKAEKVTREQVAELLRAYHPDENVVNEVLDSDVLDWDSLAEFINAPPAADGSRHMAEILVSSAALKILSVTRSKK